MDTIVTLLIYIIALLAVSILGAYTPFIRKLNDGQIHLLVALSAGIFLGILFFLLLPEAIEESIEGGYSGKDIMITVMIGFMIILFADITIKELHKNKKHDHGECHEEEHKHELTSISAFIGLGVHAFVDGLLLATTIIADSDIAFVALLGMCIHKFVELFSLSSTFLLSNESKGHIMKFMLVFALITPIAAIISYVALNGASIDGLAGLPLAFSAGTFMYVAMCDMLPEAFHRENQEFKSFILLVIGMAIAAVVFLLLGHHH